MNCHTCVKMFIQEQICITEKHGLVMQIDGLAVTQYVISHHSYVLVLVCHL